MAFNHRKFLVEEKISPDEKHKVEKKYELRCSSCDDCPDDCSQYLLPPPPPPKHHISTGLIVSLCILGAAFLFLFCFAICRYKRSRRRNSRRLENDIFRQDIVDELQGPVIDHPIWYIRTVGLPQSVIDSIEVFKYRKGEGLIEGRDCSVCLSEFQEDESLRLLPKCSHAFHIQCIDIWLRSHKNCPVCRAPVVKSNSDEVNSVEASSSDSGSTEDNQMESDAGTDEIGETMSGEGISSVLPVEDEKLAEDSWRGNGRSGGCRVLSDLADHRVKVDQELEPVRRSVSMDFSSASAIYMAVANIHGKNDGGSCDSTLFQGSVPIKSPHLVP